MKKAIVLGLICLASTTWAQKTTKSSARKPAAAAVAAPAATSKTTASTAGSATDWMANHVSVGAVLLNSTTLQDLDISTPNARGSGDLTTTYGMGVTGRYQSELNPSWNWEAGLTLYMPRDIDGVSSKLGKGNFASKPSFQPLLVSGGVQYRVNPMVYLPVGLNTSIYNNTSKGSFNSMSMDPRIGYQMGVGARLDRQFAAELRYQRVAYHFVGKLGSAKAEGEAHDDGFGLQGLYNF